MKTFLTDVKDLAKTRKFWIALAGAVVAFLNGLDLDTDVLIAILTALGVYRVPNKV